MTGITNEIKGLRKEYELLLAVRENGYKWLSVARFKQREAQLVYQLKELKVKAGICEWEQLPQNCGGGKRGSAKYDPNKFQRPVRQLREAAVPGAKSCGGGL